MLKALILKTFSDETPVPDTPAELTTPTTLPLLLANIASFSTFSRFDVSHT